MSRLIVLFLLASACARPCDESDLVVDNLCIILNGYSNRHSEIDWTVRTVQDWINRRTHGKPLDLPALFEENSASLEYVNWLRKERYGETTDDDISMLKLDKCFEHNFTLGHEFLHIIAIEYLHVDDDKDWNHDVPYLFCKDQQDQERTCNAVETDLWWSVGEYCNAY